MVIFSSILNHNSHWWIATQCVLLWILSVLYVVSGLPRLALIFPSDFFHACNKSILIRLLTGRAIGHTERMATLDTALGNTTFMMAPSNGIIYRVTGPLWGESTGHLWIPPSNASDAELWCFLRFPPEQTVYLAIGTLMIETSSHSLWRHKCVECIYSHML